MSISYQFEKIAVFDKDGRFYMSAIHSADSKALHLEVGDTVCSKCSWLNEVEYFTYMRYNGLIRVSRPKCVHDSTIEWLNQGLDWSDHPLG